MHSGGCVWDYRCGCGWAALRARSGFEETTLSTSKIRKFKFPNFEFSSHCSRLHHVCNPASGTPCKEYKEGWISPGNSVIIERNPIRVEFCIDPIRVDSSILIRVDFRCRNGHAT